MKNYVMQDFKNIVRSEIHRHGIDDLMKLICASDFETAPASTQFHNSYNGGLLDHSINVYNRLKRTNEYQKFATNETVAIVSLFHDLCKMDFYKETTRNIQDKDGKWHKVPFYKVEDNFPYGHGEKSVYIVQRFMKLTDQEALAIRYHSAGFDNNPQGACQAFKISELAIELSVADMRAAFIDEKDSY